MTLLVAGLVLFIAVHLIPSVVPLRAALIARLGAGPYRGLFSLVAAASLVLIVWGFAGAPFEPLYAVPAWGRQVAMFAVPVAVVLFAAANMPTHIRAVLRHPMLLGLLLWAIAHLLSNGDLLLFRRLFRERLTGLFRRVGGGISHIVPVFPDGSVGHDQAMA